MCSTNLSNNQSCVAPLGHFHTVAQRLGLSEQQLTHLRLMLQQYNRSMHQQLQQGMGLLQVSKDIAGVQTAVVAAQASHEQSSNEDAATAAAAAADKGAAGGDASANSSPEVLRGSSSSGSEEQRGSGVGEHSGSASEQQPQRQSSSSSNAEEVDADGLSEQLQQHLAERMQVMQVSRLTTAAAPGVGIKWCTICDM
jgi:DNA-directed RNA polymerase specialized sigma54-like protein